MAQAHMQHAHTHTPTHPFSSDWWDSLTGLAGLASFFFRYSFSFSARSRYSAHFALMLCLALSPWASSVQNQWSFINTMLQHNPLSHQYNAATQSSLTSWSFWSITICIFANVTCLLSMGYGVVCWSVSCVLSSLAMYIMCVSSIMCKLPDIWISFRIKSRN